MAQIVNICYQHERVTFLLFLLKYEQNKFTSNTRERSPNVHGQKTKLDQNQVSQDGSNYTKYAQNKILLPIYEVKRYSLDWNDLSVEESCWHVCILHYITGGQDLEQKDSTSRAESYVRKSLTNCSSD
jgi:hypothetical protein